MKPEDGEVELLKLSMVTLRLECCGGGMEGILKAIVEDDHEVVRASSGMSSTERGLVVTLGIFRKA